MTWLYQGLASLPAAQAKPISSSPEGTTRAGAWGGWALGWAPGLPWLQTTQRPVWCPAGGAILRVPRRLAPCHPLPGAASTPPRASRRPRPLGKARVVQAGGGPDTGPGRGGGGGLPWLPGACGAGTPGTADPRPRRRRGPRRLEPLGRAREVGRSSGRRGDPLRGWVLATQAPCQPSQE